MTEPTNADPVLDRLRDAARRRAQADREIRALLAYARHFTRPRPYRLADLATATGMSISGVRGAYTARDVELIADLFANRAARLPDDLINALDLMASSPPRS
ncbi:hypothetical protein GCM10009678_90350 [Actinomadura kijaniata]|uniref:Uncharacterized protein n=1 Tax=Actinomadura namibiensis TaxID=182080 RepID=A0A7W3LPH1_ACTNM|nr:hypothetical protein [Actinomadura namibiensis]MBA8951890.1 hypothetical protein [Actinomadura namibiensis]